MATAQYFNYFATGIPIGRLAATSCPKLTIKQTPGVKGCHDVVPDVDSVVCT
jgi:hypothetical protein